MFGLIASAAVLSAVLQAHAQTYSATYLPSTAPDITEEGQTGTNKCGTASNQTSSCQNLYLNSVDDFCVFAPPTPNPVATDERIEVAWCMKDGYGTRLIPDGTMKGVHFVQTPDFVQVTGMGDFTSMNIPAGDTGGELDPHGADGNGNPIGGLVFSSAFGELEQIHEWTNFMSATIFCFRACKPGPMAPQWCGHIWDVMGCAWNMPANYDTGVFENCQGDSGLPMGIYGTSTFTQVVDPITPSAHPIPSSSLCTTLTTIGNGASPTNASGSSSGSNTSSGSSSSSSPRSGSGTSSGSHSPTSTSASGSNTGAATSSHDTSTIISLLAVSAVAMFSLF